MPDREPFDEHRVDAALLRVVGPDGLTRGTAFLVADGLALTCDHVLTGLEGVQVQAVGAEPVDVARTQISSWPGADLAAISCPAIGGSALPLAAADPAPREFWTKGYQWQGSNIGGAVPLQGQIAGSLDDLSYAWEDREYTLPSALALAGEDIDHGLSGAPLIDHRWGVVVGVVNATLRRLGRRAAAIPLGAVVAREPELAELVAANGRTLPRWGPHLNARGAELVCAEQREASARRIVSDKLVLLDRYCARTEIRREVERFLEQGSAVLLPIVGASGVGKTTELVQVAAAIDGPAVLLQAAELAGSDDLAEALTAQLGTVGGEPVAAGDVAAALRAEQRRLTVLVDGFNEVTGRLGTDEAAWLRRSVSWLREHGARAIVTSRPELWARAGRDVPPTFLHGRRPFAELADFTEQETLEAIDRYGLTASGLQVREVRHPLLLRMHLNVASEGERRAVGRYEAIEQYVVRASERVAVAAGSDRFGVDSVLARLVTRGLDPQSLSISREAVLDADESRPGIVAGLLDERLLVGAGRESRFAFDEVAEYLQSRELGLETVVAMDGADQAGTSVASGALAFLVLRLERDEGVEAVRRVLGALLDRFERERGAAAEISLARIFESLRAPGAVWDEVERYVDLATREDRWYTPASALVAQIALPAPERLRLVRYLFRHASDHPWRPQDWGEDLAAFVAGRQGGPEIGSLALALVAADPAAAVPVLATWLDDTTPLGEKGWSEATIRDVGLGLLLQARPTAFSAVLDAVTDWAGGALDVLTVRFLALVADDDPEHALAWAELNLDGDLARRTAAAFVSSRVARRADPHAETWARAVPLLRRVLSADVEPAVRASAIDALNSSDETRPEVLGLLLGMLRDDGLGHSPAGVALALRSHFDAVARTLEEMVDVGGDDRLQRVYAVLLEVDLSDAEDADRLLRLLERGIAQPSADPPAPYCLEHWLWQASDTPDLLPRLERLAVTAIETGSHREWRCVAHAVGARSEDETQQALRSRLLDLLIGTPRVEVVTLPDIVIDTTDSEPWIVDRLLGAPDDAWHAMEPQLVRAALLDDEFAQRLAVAVERRVEPPTHQLMLAFRAGLRHGLTPSEAARNAYE